MESASSDHRKKSKEQELQKRRLFQSSQSSSLKPGGPLFGDLIAKSDGDSRIKSILGNYDDFMILGDPKGCFGTTNTTPSTPLLHNKHSNPFDSSFSTPSSSTSHAGASRHQVAPPPSGQSIKREKNRQISKLVKSESKNAMAGSDKLFESKSTLSQPTNILRVNKPSNKAAVKPYKVSGSQRKASPHKQAKPKVKKSHSAQFLPPTQPPPSDNSTTSSQTSSHKTKKHSHQPQDTVGASQTVSVSGIPPIKRVSSSGVLSVKTEKDTFKTEALKLSNTPSKVAKKKKKVKEKKRLKESSEFIVKLEPQTESELGHLLVERKEPIQTSSLKELVPSSQKDDSESVPTSLKVQLPKQQKRPIDLHITSGGTPSNEDTTMDAESVSSMLKELMNPLPSTLVTPIPTPIQTRPFVFPSSISQLPTVSEVSSHFQAKTTLGSTSSEEELEDARNREALATAISTVDKDLAEVGHTHISEVSSIADQQMGSVSSSSSEDESSSDSSSDSETEEVPLFSLPTTTITPIKQTPPQKLTDYVISPLAQDESANLSPAKTKSFLNASQHQTQLTVSQFNMGFNLQHKPHSEEASHSVMEDFEVSDSDSSSGSSSDSGSESDSESSDSEDQTFDAEVKPQSTARRTNLNLSQSSEEGPPFDSSGGFMEGTDILARLSSLPITSHSNSNLFGTDSMTITSNPSNLHSSSTVQSPVPTPCVGEAPMHGKRPNPSAHKTAKKVPKLSVKEADYTVDNEVLQEQPKRPISLTSSEYQSEEGEVTSETEDQPVFPPMTAPTSTNPTARQSYIETQSVQSTALQLDKRMESLMVRLPLADLKRVPDQNKPKATVEPYNIRQPSDYRVRSRPPMESDQAPPDPRAPGSRERSEGRGREGYGSVSGGRHREEYRPYSRSRRDHSRWDRESSRRYPPDDRSGRHPGGRVWDRGEYLHGDDYWTDDHADYGSERLRGRRYGGENQSYPERYMSEARRKKHEADKISPPGADKAKAYMDSVVLFMKYGDATEQQSESSSNSAPKKSSAFRTYNETLAMIKYCQNMASDCKPLVILCMRCQSVLLWRMYMIKLPTAAAIQKELQEYFIPPKGTQGKSPYPNSSSPLPSPASVGSTTSTGSGGWTSTQDPSPSGSVNVPKHIVSKATEHLTISNYVNHSVELWKNSENLLYQCRDCFTREDRSVGQRLCHSSPVSQVANWTEKVLRSFRYAPY